MQRYENVLGENLNIEDVLWKISLHVPKESNLKVLQIDMALNYFRKSRSGVLRNVCKLSALLFFSSVFVTGYIRVLAFYIPLNSFHTE